MRMSFKNIISHAKVLVTACVVVAGLLTIIATNGDDRIATIIYNRGAEIWYASVAGDCRTTQIGTTGSGTLGSMARKSSGELYAVSGETLYRVNRTTGQATNLLTITGLDVPSVRAITFDQDDNLFAVTKDPAVWDQPNKFYRIDISTGAATFIGDMTYLGIQAMETGSDGEIYVWDVGGHAFWSLGLGKVNTSTGQVTDINTADNQDEGVNVKPNLQTLVWVNQMYGLGNGNLYEIDMNTGTATMMCFGLVGGNVGGAEYVYVEWPE